MLGAFSALIALVGLPMIGITAVPLALLLALLFAAVTAGAFGFTIERIAYRPLRGSFRLAPLISAIGTSIILQNFIQISQGARPKPLPAVIEGSFAIFGAQLRFIQIGIAVVTLVTLLGFSWLVTRTRLGRAMRATEQDRLMASLLGIDTDQTISITFVIGAALAAVAGLMFLLYYGVVDFFIGFVAGIKAFTAAVLGGIGSLPGAMLGGLIIGLVETFWSAYFSVAYKDVAAFSILILVLIFRPQGLLGRAEIEKL